MRMVWSSLVAVAVAGALSNCGGGGGGGSAGGGGGGAIGRIGSGATGDRSGPVDFNAETGRNYGLAAVGAPATQAAGLIGTGITVGIIDTGIDLQHKDFEGAIAAASTDIISGVNANVDDQGGHGTSVAGVIGARRDGYDSVGLAPGSTLLAVRSENDCSPKCTFRFADLARATDYAVANGAQVLNYSLGGDTIDDDFAQALGRAVGAGRIVVAAAGNNAGATPINPAAWLAGLNGNGLGIAVGAVDGANQIASFSNQAGAAARDHFLVAPGVAITTSANGGGTRSVSGTSFAAPHVAGGAAVVWGASPFLTGDQVVDILLNSATDLGAPGTDDVYGRGLLNLDRAMQAMGEESVPTGTTVSQGAPLATTSLSLGAAFGDALADGGGLARAITLDGYDRPFRADLSGTVHHAAAADPLAGWLAPGGDSVTTRPDPRTALTLTVPQAPSPYEPGVLPGGGDGQPRFALSTELGGNSLGVARGFGLDRLTGLAAAAPEIEAPGLAGDALASPYLAMAGDGAAITAGRDLGDGFAVSFGFSQDGAGLSAPGLPEPQRQASLAEARKRFQDGSVIGAQIGTLTEASGPLASTGGGAFDFGGAAGTTFLGVYGAAPLSPNSTLFGRYGWGLTDGGDFSTGLLKDATDVTSRSFAVGAATSDVGLDGDKVAFTVSRPLRVNAGSATLAVPVGRTMDGRVLFNEHRIDLTPSGAETDLELSWTIPTGERQALTLGGLMALEPGHAATAPPAYAVGAKYRLRW